MSMNYGIKVSRPGFDVKTALPNQLAFSSAFKTLKVHASGAGSITHESRLITIPHNLGYVPLFMVHTTLSAGFGSGLFSSDDYALAPAGLGGVMPNPAIGSNDDLFAYADATNLYIKAQENFGKLIFEVSNPSNLNECLALEFTGGGGYTATGSAQVGHDPTFDQQKGAVRFGGVTIAQGVSVYQAKFNFYVDSRDGSSNISFRVFGIDEDNTAVFNSGTFPTARTKTSASVDQTTNVSPGNTIAIEATTMMNEILARGGWSSGNAMGFILDDNGTTGDNAYVNNSDNSTLSVVLNQTIASYKYTIFKNQLE